MKAAALGHQYLTVKSLNKNDNYFRGPQSRSIPRSETQTQLIAPSTEPLSRRATTIDESTEPTVTVYTRSRSETNDPQVVYESEPIKRGKD